MAAEAIEPDEVQASPRRGIAAQGVARSLSSPPRLEPEPAPVIVPGLPADEQQGLGVDQIPASSAPAWLFLLGTLLLATAAACWALPETLEGWRSALPLMGFLSALGGVVTFYFALVAMLSEPEQPAANQFVAWGRLGAGVALTIIGAVALSLIRGETWAPDETKVFAMLTMISGPVLCGWAAYGTFVKDPSQRSTGWLMIATAGAVLAILLARL
jgi:hypothetical protein